MRSETISIANSSVSSATCCRPVAFLSSPLNVDLVRANAGRGASCSQRRLHEVRNVRGRSARSITCVSSALPLDVLLSASVIATASAALHLLQLATSAGYIPRVLNRKIVHITCAPLMFATWPFYSQMPYARFVAALVPIAFIARVLNSARSTAASANIPSSLEPACTKGDSHHKVQGLSERVNIAPVSDLGVERARVPLTLIESIARADDAKSEARRGPLYYLLTATIITVVFWRRDSASGVAIAQLCFGDGFADVIGRRFGANAKWPFRRAQGKSVIGTLAFTTASFIGSAGLLFYSQFMNNPGLMSERLVSGIANQIPGLFAVSVCCALVELLVMEIDDNFSVPATAIVLCRLFGI